MVNGKQFRDRATRELQEIGKQIQSLTNERALYQRLESEVIAANVELAESNNPYLGMIRGCYTDATTMRLRRLLAPDADLSLRRLIVQFSEQPELLHDKLTGKELAGDLTQLDSLYTALKEKIDPHFSAHERTPASLQGANRELNRAIDHLADCIKRYYWIIADAYIDVEPADAADAVAIFRNSWVQPAAQGN